jgi:hypothetical protein
MAQTAEMGVRPTQLTDMFYDVLGLAKFLKIIGAAMGRPL